MLRRSSSLLAISCIMLAVAFGLGMFALPSAQAQGMKKDMKMADAVCLLYPTEGNTAEGIIHFHEMNGEVMIHVELSGLEPNSTHGFHAHEYGDCSATDGTSAGGHYNPGKHPHALPPTTPRHAGDFGNVHANDHGMVDTVITVSNVSIDGPKNPLVGKGIILHAKPDDGGQPTGNAGARIACGVIGLSKPTMMK